jgi:hypothetical protein
MVVGVVCSACKVDLSRLDSEARYKWYQSRPSWPRARASQVCGYGVFCACRPCGVHGMAHVPTLDTRLCVLRGNVPGHHLPDCECVGLTRHQFLWGGVYVTSGPKHKWDGGRCGSLSVQSGSKLTPCGACAVRATRGRGVRHLRFGRT